MMNCFFIVGPTSAGKSELAAEVARRVDVEIVSADAYQIYCGLDVLTAKPEAPTLAKAPHHLISAVPLSEELNAEKYRQAALDAIEAIHAKGKPAIVVGGSGLYIKALTHGLAKLPAANPELREELQKLSVDELHARLASLDPKTAERIDRQNPRRLIRALEICLLTRRPAAEQRTQWQGVAAAVASGRTKHRASAAETAATTTMAEATTSEPPGVFVFRDRADLYDRIDRRVELMFEQGVIEEVRRIGEIGPTAAKTLGLREIRELIAGRITKSECIASIQRATRQYAKRQLTWFRRQTNFEPLNLSHQGFAEAVEWISRKARCSFAPQDV